MSVVTRNEKIAPFAPMPTDMAMALAARYRRSTVVRRSHPTA
jgi:hypothetical protein